MEEKIAILGGHSSLTTMLLPLSGELLLLPASAVIDILSWEDPQRKEGDPEWYCGDVIWRQQKLPVVVFEPLRNKLVYQKTHETRIAVLNTLGDHSQLAFYGLVIQGIPRTLRIQAGDIRMGKTASGLPASVGTAVELQNIPAIIPRLEHLEERLLSLTTPKAHDLSASHPTSIA